MRSDNLCFSSIAEGLVPALVRAQELAARILQDDRDLLLFAKGREDVVGRADLEVEAYLVNVLREILPDASIDSEESVLATQPRRWTWVLDPIDGSQNLSFGLPLGGTTVALLEGGHVRFAAAASVVTKEVVWAANDGAARWGHPQQSTVVSLPTELTGRVSLLRGSQLSGANPEYLELLRILNISSARVYETRAPTIDVHLAARGALDAIVCLELSGHETPAVVYLLERMGLERIAPPETPISLWQLPRLFVLCRPKARDQVLSALNWTQ